jgi:hypothetical protein
MPVRDLMSRPSSLSSQVAETVTETRAGQALLESPWAVSWVARRAIAPTAAGTPKGFEFQDEGYGRQ